MTSKAFIIFSARSRENYFLLLLNDNCKIDYFMRTSFISREQKNARRWIITAAHCLNGKKLTALLGLGPTGKYQQNITVDGKNQHAYPYHSQMDFDFGMSH